MRESEMLKTDARRVVSRQLRCMRTESCKKRKEEGGKAKTKIFLSTKVSEAASDGVKRWLEIKEEKRS